MAMQTRYDERQATPRYISGDDYLEHYAHLRYEWVKGELIQLSPVSRTQDQYLHYLRKLIEAYFEFNPIGEVIGDGFVMEVELIDSKREPDLMIILHTNPGQLTETRMIGAADVCIEIVSDESVVRDYNDKLIEYQLAGVKEYWIFDPKRQEQRFLRANDQGRFVQQGLDENGNYRTPLLPQLIIHTPTLWQQTLPKMSQIVEMVRAMFAEPDANVE